MTTRSAETAPDQELTPQQQRLIELWQADNFDTDPLGPKPISELLARERKETPFLIPELLPLGQIMAITGRPQVGKTPFVIQLGLSVASGTQWSTGLEGLECEWPPASAQAGVLFLSLERGEGLLYRLLKAQLGDEPAPAGVYYETTWPRFGKAGGEAKMRAWLKAHPTVKLVVIDHWGLAKPADGRDGVKAYDDDYAAVMLLRELANDLGVSFVLVTHSNQSKDNLDMMAAFYGNTGFVAAVDVRVQLERNQQKSTGTLRWGGTEVEPQSQAMKFAYPKWYWMRGKTAPKPDHVAEEDLCFKALVKFPLGAKYGEWLAATGMKESTFNRHRGALLDAGYVRRPERKGEKWLALPEPLLAE